MPDPRPLPTLRPGAFDEPPATSESSTPQTRRSRLRRAIEGTRDLARDQMSTRVTLPIPTRGVQRRVYVAPSTRRRQRSLSLDHQDDVRTTPEEADDGRRRRYKRRRLDTSPPVQPRQGIKYGYYGQVEPGRLKLELISCDGGEHRDPRHPATSLGPENLLRHDKSVYCSERPSVNVVLRHADDTPFCLEKLWVAGPEHGFTAPVREGIVYISMTMGPLQKYIDPPPHARLQETIHLTNTDNPPYRRRRDRSLHSSPERLTLSDALRDPDLNAAFTSPRDQQYPNPIHDQENYYGTDFGFGRTDPEAHCEIPSSSDILTSNFAEDDSLPNSGGRAVTLLTDEEPEPEDNSSQDVLDYRLQRLRLARRRYETETFDREDRWAGLNRLPPDVTERERESQRNLHRLDTLMARSRVHDSATPERDHLQLPTIHQDTTTYHPQHLPPFISQDHVDDPAVTAARFFIRRGKYRVAIKFDPPVSGRFLLVKFWAGDGESGRGSVGGNVDVQSLIALGWGGGRFFPAVAVR